MNQNQNKTVTLSKKLTMNGPANSIGSYLVILFPFMCFACLALDSMTLFVFCVFLLILGCFGLFSIETVTYDKATNTIIFCKNILTHKYSIKSYFLKEYNAIQIFYELGPPKLAPLRSNVASLSTVTNTTLYPTQKRAFIVFLINADGCNLKIKRFTDKDKAYDFQKNISELTELPINISVRVKNTDLC